MYYYYFILYLKQIITVFYKQLTFKELAVMLFLTPNITQIANSFK